MEESTDFIEDQMSKVKLEMEESLNKSRLSQQKLESDLVVTKQKLLEVQAQLDLAEKELEKKFSQTAAYTNMKKMLSTKNDQIKELRTALATWVAASSARKPRASFCTLPLLPASLDFEFFVFFFLCTRCCTQERRHMLRTCHKLYRSCTLVDLVLLSVSALPFVPVEFRLKILNKCFCSFWGRRVPVVHWENRPRVLIRDCEHISF